MQLKPRAYPHPVLHHLTDDVVGAQFQQNVRVRGTQTAYVFEVLAKTSSKDLRRLIAEGKAQYAVHVECATTRYRRLFSSTDERYGFEIEAATIDERVEVCSLIVAAEDIAAYANAQFHPDYGGATFAVRKGDTLAVASDSHFTADKKLDPLAKIPSIFVVVASDDPNAPAMDVDTDGPKVRVTLSKDGYAAYAHLRHSQTLAQVLTSMIVVPALVVVLEELKTAVRDDELAAYECHRWYATVARRLRDFEVEPERLHESTPSTLALVHKLIGEPLQAGLRSLRAYEEDESEDD